MFTIENPAQSLNEVIDFLKTQHNDNYVYRGQISDYETMLPSLFRNINFSKIGEYFTLPKDYKGDRANVIKVTFTGTLVKKFGSITGDYLAQQYLAKSGCIDVTDDLDVAAFFSKMLFPKYDLSILDDTKIGVIFRFNKNEFTSNFKPHGANNNPFDTSATNQINAFINKNDVESFVTSDFIDDPENYYVIHSNVTSYSDIKDYLDEIDTNHRNFLNLEKNESYCHFKRARVQSGGMIQPNYLCKYGKEKFQVNDYSDVVGIEDIYHRYSIEKFYFRHTSAELKYTKHDIWPGIDEDITFATLCWLFSGAKSSKLIEEEIKIFDIVDFGYDDNIPTEFLSD